VSHRGFETGLDEHRLDFLAKQVAQALLPSRASPRTEEGVLNEVGLDGLLLARFISGDGKEEEHHG